MSLFKSFLLGNAFLFVMSFGAYADEVDEDIDVPPSSASQDAATLDKFEPPGLPSPANCKGLIGYYIVPNSMTCLKINGMLRSSVYLHSDNIASDKWYAGAFSLIQPTTTTNDTWTMSSSAFLGADTITETPYGKLRGNILLQATPAVSLRYAFIEWNNFTIGHTDSFFVGDFAKGIVFGAVGEYGFYRRTLFGYTAKFNDTISASLSLEDHDAQDLGDGTAGADEAHSTQSQIILSPLKVNNDGTQLPDLVGNIIGKGDWGRVFVSGAVGHYRTIEAVSREQDDFMGWALGFGGTANLDMINKGDNIQGKFGYSDGALGYITYPGAYAVVDTTADTVATTTAWSAEGSYFHNWAPSLNSTFFTGYTAADYTTDPVNTHAVIEGKPAAGWNVGGNLRWMPVAGMQLVTEVAYGNVTRAHDGAPTTNDDGFSSVFRAQRNF